MIETVVLSVLGMKCGGCEAGVTAALKSVDGVIDVKASSKDKQVSLVFDAEKTTLDVLKSTIKTAGYSV